MQRETIDTAARGRLRGRRSTVLLLGLISALACAGLVLADGAHHHAGDTALEITTSAPEAQALFDQGVHTAWGFNHIEAARLFRASAEADPSCAMCWWGVAWVLGPNINAPLDPAYFEELRGALDRAVALSPEASPKEQAFIAALQERYGAVYEEDRAARDKAFADAMRRVALRFPDDLTAATLFAEALMDTTPWDYWLEDGEPKQVTQEFIQVLETVLRRDPVHPGANHLLIHAVEKARPELGVPAAERLEKAQQATGHLVHMASHIYIRVGRYDDAARVNARAIAEDDAYAATHEVPAEYVGYMLHNHHMRWAALAFDGRRAASHEEALYLRANTDEELMRQPGFGALQHYWTMPYWSYLRFGDWEELLAEPEPAADLAYPRGVRHFARGVALARSGRSDEAAAELAALERATVDRSLDEMSIWGLNSNRSVLEVAQRVLAGEIAAARGERPAAVAHFERGVELEDAMVYDEPPTWPLPVRQRLGAAALEAGDAEAAERAFRGDLEIYPFNGWSLHGLARALESQDQKRAARKVRKDLERSWQRADYELDPSRGR